MGKGFERPFSKDNIQMTNKHEKVLSIINHQGNANQNHNNITTSYPLELL